jgi:AcrR family transcriptional regulator
MSADSRPADTRTQILEAAGQILRTEGYAALSTRRIAEAAGVPLSQTHYHFGSRQGLVLALLEHEDAKLLDRQAALYSSDRPLSEKWALACDYGEEDLASGYIRLLHEMAGAGYSNEQIAAAMRERLNSWYDLLVGVARQAIRDHGPVGPFSADEIALLVGQSFLGLQMLLLLDAADARKNGIGALRKVGAMIAERERRVGDD